MDGNDDGSLVQTYRYAMDAAGLDYLLPASMTVWPGRMANTSIASERQVL